MQKTLKLLNPLISKDLMNTSFEELSELYKEDKNPIVLATSFHRIYKLAIVVGKKFPIIGEEEIESQALTCLDKALLTFKVELGYTFNTYYTTILHNELRPIKQSLETDKQKANLKFNSNSYEVLAENGFDPGCSEYTPIWLTMETLKSNHLSERELQYCYLIMCGYSTGEIIKTLKVSAMTLTNIKKRLRDKIDPTMLVSF